MKTTTTKTLFTEIMAKPDYGFSYAGACALFDYLEEYEQETGTEMDFDPVALRCEFTEFSDYNEILETYDLDCLGIDEEEFECMDEDEQEEAVIEALRERTTVIVVTREGCEDRYIVAEF